MLSYDSKIDENVKIDSKNNDSYGAVICSMDDLKKDILSEIAILELEKQEIRLI